MKNNLGFLIILIITSCQNKQGNTSTIQLPRLLYLIPASNARMIVKEETKEEANIFIGNTLKEFSRDITGMAQGKNVTAHLSFTINDIAVISVISPYIVTSITNEVIRSGYEISNFRQFNSGRSMTYAFDVYWTLK